MKSVVISRILASLFRSSSSSSSRPRSHARGPRGAECTVAFGELSAQSSSCSAAATSCTLDAEFSLRSSSSLSPSSSDLALAGEGTRKGGEDEEKMGRMRRGVAHEAVAKNEAYVADLREASQFSRACASGRALLPLHPRRSQQARRSFAAMAEALEALAGAHEALGAVLREAAEGEAWRDAESTALWDAAAALQRGPAAEAYRAYVGGYAATVALLAGLRRDSRAFRGLCGAFAQRHGSLPPEAFAIKPVQRLPQLSCLLAAALANTPASAPRALAVAQAGVASFASWTASINSCTAALLP
eukprot:m51a1_g8569 hypothetical protein (302) ;mRNA; f:190753-192013